MVNFRLIKSTIILQMKQSFSRSMFRFTIIVSPIFTGLFLGFVYMERSTTDFINYAMIGNATMTMWLSIAFSSAGDIERERYMGALGQIFNSPNKFIHIMLAKVIGNTILGTFSMIGSFLFVGIVFKINIIIQYPLLFLLVFITSVISYMMIGLMLSGLLSISRQTRLVMNSMDYIIFLLTGSIFPITILPPFLRMFSFILTPTYAIRLLRMTVSSHIDTTLFIKDFTILLGLMFIYLILSLKFYNVIEYKARKNATLEVV